MSVCALLSTTTEGLHQLIHSAKEHSENKGLFLNIKKTKIVDTDRCKKTSDIIVDGETVECLENFEYLGVVSPYPSCSVVYNAFISGPAAAECTLWNGRGWQKTARVKRRLGVRVELSY